MHECVLTVASTICFKDDDFLVNNLAGDKSWFHSKQNSYISKQLDLLESVRKNFDVKFMRKSSQQQQQ
jgi:hypothetical protein